MTFVNLNSAKEATNYKVIASGHINLQNRNNPAQVDELAANQFVTVKFDLLQPIFHRIVAGHQLGSLFIALITNTRFVATNGLNIN